MGTLLPEDFPLGSLANDAERDVVTSLRDGLSDDWLVMPHVGLLGDRDREIDVVIAHPRNGVFIVEVKGHRVQLRSGIWYDQRGALDPQPTDQAKGNAFALRDRLRELGPSLGHLRVDYALAFPNTRDVSGSLPTDLDRSHVMFAVDLDDIDDAVHRFITSRSWTTPIAVKDFEQIVAVLRPDADFEMDPDARARRARARLETMCGHQVRALERLDANRRVVVTGGAGSGKTRLAMAWARRATVRGDRTLLTCYNDPLGASMRQRMNEHDDFLVGSFFEVALRLPGLPELERPERPDAAWWETTVVGHLVKHWHLIEAQFDTIVVDEAQDFSPAWLALLEQLLDPDGARRMLLVADTEQELYERGFHLPSSDDGWTVCELVNNCRNTFQIAQLLRRRLDGAPAPFGGPESTGIEFVAVHGLDAAVVAVGETLASLHQAGMEPGQVLVATVSTTARDTLREGLGLVTWEDSVDGSAIACENVHRVKGLEYDHVVLVAPTEPFDKRLAYVGVSRAILGLTVVGHAEIGERLGLTTA